MTEEDAAERIARRLARAGVASRRVAETMIAAGRVAVNGRIIDSPALNVTAADKVTLDGRPVAEPEPMRLWRYYKPIGLVTTERDERGRDTVFAHLPEDMPRVMSIGRLDLNSEGLLLLTNDGALKRRLELPSTGGCASTGCGRTGSRRMRRSTRCAGASPSRASGSSRCG